MNPKIRSRLDATVELLKELGMPRAQQNSRSAVCLLALLDLAPDVPWSNASNPQIGITPIMDWAKSRYLTEYAPNSRETFRRFTMHQFVHAGIALYNPDDPSRPVNSPKAVYQIEPYTLELLRTYESPDWTKNLAVYLASRQTLVDKYAKERDQVKIPVTTQDGIEIQLSPGEHSELIRRVIENFAPRFAPGCRLIYAGDTGKKWGYFDSESMESLGFEVDAHGIMPDVVLFDADRMWLLLVEAVTSHGPVDGKRHAELTSLFAGCSAGLVFVTAFPNRLTMARYLNEIAWESEVWIADSPSHLIHFNGERFLGPYGD